MGTLTESPAWRALEAHRDAIAGRHMRDLFAEDPNRFDAFTLRFEEILFDFSKNRITAETLALLRDLARQADLSGWTERMFSGAKINITEDRAVLHIALRNRSNRPILVDGMHGHARLGLRAEDGIAWRRIFDATAPVLPGFAATKAFEF